MTKLQNLLNQQAEARKTWMELDKQSEDEITSIIENEIKEQDLSLSENVEVVFKDDSLIFVDMEQFQEIKKRFSERKKELYISDRYRLMTVNFRESYSDKSSDRFKAVRVESLTNVVDEVGFTLQERNYYRTSTEEEIQKRVKTLDMVNSINKFLLGFGLERLLNTVNDIFSFDYDEVNKIKERDYEISKLIREAEKEEKQNKIEELLAAVKSDNGLDIEVDESKWRKGLTMTLNWQTLIHEISNLKIVDSSASGKTVTIETVNTRGDVRRYNKVRLAYVEGFVAKYLKEKKFQEDRLAQEAVIERRRRFTA